MDMPTAKGFDAIEQGTQFVIEIFAESVFFHEEHGIDFAKTTTRPLDPVLYRTPDGQRTSDLQHARVFLKMGKVPPLTTPSIERCVPVTITRKE